MENYKIYGLKTSGYNIKNNCYIIINKFNNNAAIVDPSWELDKVTNLLNKLRVKLEIILLTHSHYDHVSLVRHLVKMYNAKVYMSSIEIDFYKYSSENLIRVEDDSIIYFNDIKIKCILTPGHTAGGMCYIFDKYVFTGDTVFNEGCGMCNTEGGSAEAMYYSIQKLKRILKPDTYILPGHAYYSESRKQMKDLLRENIYFQFKNINDFCNFRMRKNQFNLFNFK